MRILQARILERAAIPFSRGSSQPKDQTQVYCIAGRFFTIWVTRETQSPPIFHHFLSSIGHQGQKPTQTGSSLRGLLKEDSCISSWSPGPVARLWKVSRIAQSASAHLIEAARPASLCPATSFSSGYRLAFSAHSSIHTSPWWLLLNCDPCSESAGPAGLAFSSLLAQSFNIHWFQNPRRENLICPYLNSCLTLVQSTVNDGSAFPRGWTGHIV